MRLDVLCSFIRAFRAHAIAVSGDIVGSVPGPDWVGVGFGCRSPRTIRYVRPLICAFISCFLPEAFRLGMIAMDHHKWVVSLLRVATFPLVALRFERRNASDIGGMSGAQTGPTYAQFGQRCCHSLSASPQHTHHFQHLADSNEGALHLRMVDRSGLHVQLMGYLIQVVPDSPDLSEGAFPLTAVLAAGGLDGQSALDQEARYGEFRGLRPSRDELMLVSSGAGQDLLWVLFGSRHTPSAESLTQQACRVHLPGGAR